MMFEAASWAILPTMHILVEPWAYWFLGENDSSSHEYIGWAMSLFAPWIMRILTKRRIVYRLSHAYIGSLGHEYIYHSPTMSILVRLGRCACTLVDHAYIGPWCLHDLFPTPCPRDDLAWPSWRDWPPLVGWASPVLWTLCPLWGIGHGGSVE